MHKRPIFWAFVVTAMALLAAGQEPKKPPLSPRIITATRQVSIFTGLEKQILQAVQKKDKTALQAMLDDEFEIHMPDADPLAGDDWVESVITPAFSLKSYVLRQMAVVDLGDSALVKYDRILQSTYKGKNDGGEFFVVDLWKKNGDSWKLASRYVAKVGSIPATTKVQPKPSGKE